MEKKYEINKDLIKNLGYYYIEDKYNLNNNNINKSIYLAASSLYEHIKVINNVENKIEGILVGDFLSFEYYDILKDDLKKLQMLSSIMGKNYLYLIKENITKRDIRKIAISLPLVLFEFYNKKIMEKDKEILIEKFLNSYDILSILKYKNEKE
ncbi:hypothetical protein [Gemelliphila asaccharolytica]|uniref:Uncharacterized protein n=1 Tax=Gemelliphila asaccharolytica TaxID=502393 RepID=A0ABR5TMF3_9BACL|nr:hypothetical protein [Gemella asaccharolytica]KXB58451.1 hypothetical protein HMPREF1871_00475 [Gemella asaccharolytica]